MTQSLLKYENFTDDPFKSLKPYDETKGALEVLEWAYSQYGDSIVYSCSFGAESMVLIHLISSVKSDAEIIFLDTDLHFQETYELIDRIKEKYPSLKISLKKPDLTLSKQAEAHGNALWKRDPNQCCYVRKIQPLEKALSGRDAWISGLRRDQSFNRRNTDFVNKDERFKSVKVCPLIHWTWDDVWAYISKYQLPYNSLHDFNYPSIGCIPCTSAVLSGEDSRAGRWTGSEKTECGLHTSVDPSK